MKKKIGKISMGIMLRHMKKPETIWGKLSVKPTTGAHGKKLYMVSSDQIALASMIASPNELDALRAAQPTKLVFPILAEEERQKLIAQGKKETLSELNKLIAKDEKDRAYSVFEFDFIKEWIAAKRAELEKEAKR